METTVYKAVRARLAGGTALVSALGGTAIYAEQVPEGAAMPYVVMQIAGGGADNSAQGTALDVSVNVKCVATSAATAGTVNEAIFERLHDATLTSTDNWVFYRCQQDGVFSFVENVDRKQYWHKGGVYRVRGGK